MVLPTLRDPRLHLAAVIVSLQVLGQTVLGFELSIAQILVSVLACAVLEVGLTLWRRRVVMWTASALLTGNGVAFILRVPGTTHGDWWSVRGAWIFVAAAAISLLSKYLVRVRGRHIFNPNLGLVVVFLALGTRVVNPQDPWWAPMRQDPGHARPASPPRAARARQGSTPWSWRRVSPPRGPRPRHPPQCCGGHRCAWSSPTC